MNEKKVSKITMKDISLVARPYKWLIAAIVVLLVLLGYGANHSKASEITVVDSSPPAVVTTEVKAVVIEKEEVVVIEEDSWIQEIKAFTAKTWEEFSTPRQTLDDPLPVNDVDVVVPEVSAEPAAVAPAVDVSSAPSPVPEPVTQVHREPRVSVQLLAVVPPTYDVDHKVEEAIAIVSSNRDALVKK